MIGLLVRLQRWWIDRRLRRNIKKLRALFERSGAADGVSACDRLSAVLRERGSLSASDCEAFEQIVREKFSGHVKGPRA